MRLLHNGEEPFVMDRGHARHVGRAAEVPFVLITYHFQSKLGLYQALFRRRQDLLTTQRLERLKAVEITGDRSADILQIAAAILEPLIRIRELPGGLDFARLITREICDPLESQRGIVAEYLDPVAYAALTLLQQVAPGVSYAQICWAFYFASGALAINNANTGRVERISSSKAQTANASEVVTMLTNFVAEGWSGMFSSAAIRPNVSSPNARRTAKRTADASKNVS